MAKQLSIGQYLLDQLYRHGIRHIFGVPGDYVLGFYRLIEKSSIQHVGMTREDAAGFAADAYARVRGLGAACVTYCVGGFNALNPIAGAYAEKSPVILISGAPGVKERAGDPLLHHRVGDFSTQRRVFSHVTVAHTALDDPTTAYREIDRVIHAVERYKRPGYIELPRDMLDAVYPHSHRDQTLEDMTDADALTECIAEATGMLNASVQPVIVAGVEVHRFGLQQALVALAEKARIPVVSTMLSKSVIGEMHPLYLGVYEGRMGHPEVRRYVESADCLLMLGFFMTDIDLGIYTARLDIDHAIDATAERTSIRRHSFENVPFRSFFKALLHAPLKRHRKPELPKPAAPFSPKLAPDDRVTMKMLFPLLNQFIGDDTIVISDVGDSLFGAMDLYVHKRTEFLGPAYYASMGFATPAAVGVQMADPSLRPLVLVGDGAFQMTGMELSTIARLGLNPIVIVLNNHGYGTERQIMDGSFNDIHDWHYSSIPQVLGTGTGFAVQTRDEFRDAMNAALACRDCFSIIEVNLDRDDMSPGLARLGEWLGKRVKGKTGASKRR